MTANAFHNISQVESSLWEAADQLRANSKLTASKHSMLVLGLIFLHHALRASTLCCLMLKRLLLPVRLVH